MYFSFVVAMQGCATTSTGEGLSNIGKSASEGDLLSVAALGITMPMRMIFDVFTLGGSDPKGSLVTGAAATYADSIGDTSTAQGLRATQPFPTVDAGSPQVNIGGLGGISGSSYDGMMYMSVSISECSNRSQIESEIISRRHAADNSAGKLGAKAAQCQLSKNEVGSFTDLLSLTEKCDPANAHIMRDAVQRAKEQMRDLCG